MMQITKPLALVLLGCGGLLAGSLAHAQAPIRDRDKIISPTVRSYKMQQQINVVMQRRDYSCGAAAAATICQYFWGDPFTEADYLRTMEAMLTPEELRDRVENGMAITDLRRASVKLGYVSAIGTLELHELFESKVPLVIPIKLEGHDHFVVYRGFDGTWVYLADPIRGNVRATLCDFQCQWQKNAILVIAKKGQKPPEHSKLSIIPAEVFRGEMNRQLIRTQPPRINSPYRLSPTWNGLP